MPQGQGPQATPPFVPGKTAASSSSSTSSTTTKPTVPTEITEAFKGFLSSVFGQNPAVAAPGQPNGMQTPAVVGGLPPQLTQATPLSQPTPVPQQARTSQMPTRQLAPAGTQFASGGARNENIAATFGQALVSSIEQNKAKKDQDNIDRAQNTMNTFLHAIQQNDMYTANLYASDPKITQMWEKYLKQEYKRVPGSPKGKEETPQGLASSGMMPTQETPLPPGVQGGVNEPGGIAIPRDMTPEGQIRQRQLAAIQDVMSRQSSEQIAEGAGVGGAALSPEEFKKTSLMKYGLALTKEQEETLSAQQKIAQANVMADVIKYTVGQQSMTTRAMISAGATEGAAKIRANASMAVMREHMKGLKDIQNLKGTALATALYQQSMKTYGDLAGDLQKKLSDPDAGKKGIWWTNDEERKAMEAQRDSFLQKAADAKAEWEGLKLINEFFPELADSGEPSTTTPVEQEVQ